MVLVVLTAGLLTSCGFRRKKYENPIAKDTQQPDKILYDKAIRDIEHGRFDIARLTLQTLISTYDTSEFLAKAKLAIADSWFREGGSGGLAQAAAEYKDFILFYPTLEEAPEAQQRLCMIPYRQMEKPDRDTERAIEADRECRQLLVQYPNSRFAPNAQQLLRNIQEVLAAHEFRVGDYYHTKGSYPAAANRLEAMANHYPLYSQTDEALWKLADSYSRMGSRFNNKTAEIYARIARDYPLSVYADAAKKKLEEMELPIPEADPVALARMKYEQANVEKQGFMGHFWGVFKKSPDTSAAAKSGMPSMASLQPGVPVSVPPASAGVAGASTDVTVSTVSDTTPLDTLPDARQNPPVPAAAGQSEALPSNKPAAKKKQDASKKQQKKTQAPTP